MYQYEISYEPNSNLYDIISSRIVYSIRILVINNNFFYTTLMAFAKKMMIKNQIKVAGIIGGVGPLSHTDFERFLLRLNSNAKKDQDHPVYLLANATITPNRPDAVKAENNGDIKPAKEVEETLVYFAQILAKGGADFLIVLCNGAHFWHSRVSKQIPIPWIHMIEETAKSIVKDYPKLSRIGILASDATLLGKLYHEALINAGLIPIAPSIESPTQKLVMNATFYAKYAVKATGDIVSPQARQELMTAAEDLHKKGAQAVICGCTEISVALTSDYYSKTPLIDPLRVIAQTTLDLAMGKKRSNGK